MKRTITAVVLGSVLAGSAMAGSPPHWTNSGSDNSQRDSHDRNRHDNDRGDRRDFRDPRPGQRNDGWRNDNRHYSQERYRAGRYVQPRGYYERRWGRGDRLPRAYFARPYIVYGYRSYHLYNPPRGYHWVRVRNDVFLTALATGIVLDAVYNLYY